MNITLMLLDVSTVEDPSPYFALLATSFDGESLLASGKSKNV